MKKFEDVVKIEDAKEFQEALELMQKEYAIINRNGKVYILNDDEKNGLIYSDIESFKNFYKHLYLDIPVLNTTRVDRKYLCNAFIESKDTKRLKGIIFNPKEPVGLSGKYLNLWKGFKYEPIKGSVDKFLDLIKECVNHNKDGYEYVLNYLAHSVQRPEDIPRTALVFKGEQGTGKGTLIQDTILKLTDNSLHLVNIEQLTGQFNEHTQACLYTFLDELSFGGNTKEANILKTFISESTRLINGKNKTAFEVDVFQRVFIASNNDFVVKVEQGDRRYVIFETSNTLKGNFLWFDSYRYWLKNGGYNNIMHFLLNRDIRGFDTNIIPKTKEKTDLMLKSSDLSIKFLVDLLNNEISIKHNIFRLEDRIYRKEFYNLFIEYCNTYHKGSYILSVKEFNDSLLKLFKFNILNDKWKTNWKDSNDYYFKTLSKIQMMENISNNYFNCEVNEIFHNYNTEKEILKEQEKEMNGIFFDESKFEKQLLGV